MSSNMIGSQSAAEKLRRECQTGHAESCWMREKGTPVKASEFNNRSNIEGDVLNRHGISGVMAHTNENSQISKKIQKKG
ncbi:hypothetical protein K1T71_003024 [Dendrolimus kikuchii]|uniref:Uncharacterized protein n=1 Tax=Dendrolimus kikuchii TaxID=765133 RepID=A0ACC1DB13_9NEOP|nr:hypothetical protein K1T71_003024 [Dendrolimus kikuchii]